MPYACDNAESYCARPHSNHQHSFFWCSKVVRSLGHSIEMLYLYTIFGGNCFARGSWDGVLVYFGLATGRRPSRIFLPQTDLGASTRSSTHQPASACSKFLAHLCPQGIIPTSFSSVRKCTYLYRSQKSATTRILRHLRPDEAVGFLCLP